MWITSIADIAPCMIMAMDGPVLIADLFANLHAINENRVARDERATLIGYFAQEVERPAKLIAIRVCHYKLAELYALQSCFKDRFHRNGKTPARRYFWYITRTYEARH